MKFVANTPELSTGVVTKTLLQIEAPANTRVKVLQWSISFKGTSNTDPPVFVEVLRQASAGSMTSNTPRKWHSGDNETIQTNVTDNATSEPSSSDLLISEEVHPQTGYTWPMPDGETPLEIRGGERLGFRVTTSVDQTAVVRVIAEE